MPNLRSTPIPYTPAPPPEVPDMRAVWDELYRIAAAFSQADRPMSLSANAPDTLNFGPGSPAFVRLLNNPGLLQPWSVPEDILNPTTGVFTFPSEGVFQVHSIVTVNPALVPGDRDYTLEVRTTLVHASGAPDEVFTLRDSGNDSFFLTVSNTRLFPVVLGDQVYFDARCVTSGGAAGTVPAQARVGLYRISAVR